MSVTIEDYSVPVMDGMNSQIVAALHTIGGSLVGQIQRICRVDTGQLKGSWKYSVDESALSVRVGSPLENAVWNEFGTGEYAIHGDGRKTPWRYRDAHGKWHTTTGKRPRRTLQTAFNVFKPKITRIIEDHLRGD